jgi:hypothetical protein
MRSGNFDDVFTDVFTDTSDNIHNSYGNYGSGYVSIEDVTMESKANDRNIEQNESKQISVPAYEKDITTAPEVLSKSEKESSDEVTEKTFCKLKPNSSGKYHIPGEQRPITIDAIKKRSYYIWDKNENKQALATAEKGLLHVCEQDNQLYINTKNNWEKVCWDGKPNQSKNNQKNLVKPNEKGILRIADTKYEDSFQIGNDILAKHSFFDRWSQYIFKKTRKPLTSNKPLKSAEIRSGVVFVPDNTESGVYQELVWLPACKITREQRVLVYGEWIKFNSFTKRGHTHPDSDKILYEKDLNGRVTFNNGIPIDIFDGKEFTPVYGIPLNKRNQYKAQLENAAVPPQENQIAAEKPNKRKRTDDKFNDSPSKKLKKNDSPPANDKDRNIGYSTQNTGSPKKGDSTDDTSEDNSDSETPQLISQIGQTSHSRLFKANNNNTNQYSNNNQTFLTIKAEAKPI